MSVAVPLDRFASSLLSSNPFERNRISDPSQLVWDVADIHAAEFARLIQLAEQVLHSDVARGVLLLGNAGTGKSHLLARLGQWAARRDACYVYLHNIQARPAGMSRYLLKCCISKLAEDRASRLHQTLLFRVIQAAVEQAAVAAQVDRVNSSTYPAVCARLAHQFGGDAGLFPLVFRLFFHGAKAVQSHSVEKRAEHALRAALALRWLRGDVLDADEASLLGQSLRPSDETAELPEEQVEQVLAGVARLGRVSGRPFLLCVDQADNMQHDQLAALAKSLHSLIDSAQNLLVVVSGVQEDMYQLIRTNVIHAAAADRLDHLRPVVLHRIKRPAARVLVRERLHGWLAGLEPLPPPCEAHRREDDLFPLGSVWFDGIEGNSLELRPRDVLTWAHERWCQIQQQVREQGAGRWLEQWPGMAGGVPRDEGSEESLLAAIDQRINTKLEETVAARHLDPGTLPADAGNLLGLTLQLLEQCVHRERGYPLVRVTANASTTAELLTCARHADHEINSHVVFVVTGSKTSAAAQLRRLLNSPNAQRRILVTDHDRMPLQLGTRGEQYLDELRQLGPQVFTEIPLTFDQYARLDALMAVITQARSGDLELPMAGGTVHRISEDEVLESYHRQDRYRQHGLLRWFLAEPSAPSLAVAVA
ncbi:MAG: hypothetical protein AB7F89_01200 [Pirellulaceae bacterium]